MKENVGKKSSTILFIRVPGTKYVLFLGSGRTVVLYFLFTHPAYAAVDQTGTIVVFVGRFTCLPSDCNAGFGATWVLCVTWRLVPRRAVCYASSAVAKPLHTCHVLPTKKDLLILPCASTVIGKDSRLLFPWKHTWYLVTTNSRRGSEVYYY